MQNEPLKRHRDEGKDLPGLPDPKRLRNEEGEEEQGLPESVPVKSSTLPEEPIAQAAITGKDASIVIFSADHIVLRNDSDSMVRKKRGGSLQLILSVAWGLMFDGMKTCI